MKKFARLLPVLLLSLVTGCALSPLELDVNPRVTLEQSERSYSGAVAVTVYDERISDTLGSRGGVYGDTNDITTSSRLPLSMRSAVELALREMGIRVTDSVDVPQFQVYLDRLEYSVPEGSYITKVDLLARIRVHIVDGNRRLEGAYSGAITERVPKAPSDEKNQELVDRVLSDVLNRVFADPKLQDFLADS